MAKGGIKNDPVFKIFKDNFQVTLFYKPEFATKTDTHYHIILDSCILLQLMILGRNFIVIDTIQPLTSGYMPNMYTKLIDTLCNQTEFSVLIEKLGNVSVINDACIKKGIPIVVDDKFITIPKKLYNMYLRFHKDNENNCGFYLLAMNSTEDDIPKEEDNIIKKEVIKPVETVVKPVIPDNPIIHRNKDDLANEDLSIVDRVLSLFDNRTTIEEVKDTPNTYTLSYLGKLHIEFKHEDRYIILGKVTTNNSVKSVDFMELLTILEDLCLYFTVVLEDVRNRYVYDICDIRGYNKNYLTDNGPRLSTPKHSFGTYVMVRRKK